MEDGPTRTHTLHTIGSGADTRHTVTGCVCVIDLGSAACQPSAEAGAGPVAERARADEFDAVGGACGEASEMAIAVLHGALGGAADKPEVDTLDDP